MAEVTWEEKINRTLLDLLTFFTSGTSLGEEVNIYNVPNLSPGPLGV